MDYNYQRNWDNVQDIIQKYMEYGLSELNRLLAINITYKKEKFVSKEN